MRVVKKIRCNPGKIPTNLRYNDRKKVRAATVMINKLVYPIKTETSGNVVAEMVGYRKTEMTENRQPNWGRKILEKHMVLRKEFGQLNRMRQRESQNEGVISKPGKLNVKSSM